MDVILILRWIGLSPTPYHDITGVAACGALQRARPPRRVVEGEKKRRHPQGLQSREPTQRES